jgi:hypothetical protein
MDKEKCRSNCCAMPRQNKPSRHIQTVDGRQVQTRECGPMNENGCKERERGGVKNTHCVVARQHCPS